MTPEEREILRRVEMLAEENNSILKKSQRNARISAIFRTFYWIVILGVTFGAYIYIQPYIEKMMPVLNTAISEISSLQNAPR